MGDSEMSRHSSRSHHTSHIDSQSIPNVKRTLILCIAGYIFLVVAFYWLAGYQLHYRESRENYEMPPAEAITVELAQGNVVEQTFTVKIQRLMDVSVQWGAFDRTNGGTTTMELYNLLDGSLVMSQSFPVAEISEGGLTTLSAPAPIETVYDVPLLLRITSDSLAGSAATPLMSVSEREDGFSLSLNGQPVEGTLCMSVSGEEYVWTGLHYWEFAFGLGILLLLAMGIVWYRFRNGKRSYVVGAMIAVKKYRFLIRQLVSRDFKTKYKRSVLGMFWSFLNPLLTMAVQYVVFSNLFRIDVPYFQSYLIIGIVFFNFFTESTNMALGSIVGNAGLITKVYMPKYIYPVTKVMSSLVNLLISLIPLMIVILFSGIVPTKAFLLVPFALGCLTIFSLGVGMFLASLMVFFRDTQFLWGVLSMIWMYLSAIFYPASILPDNLVWVLDINPIYNYVLFARTCMIDGISPEPMLYAKCFVMAAVSLVIGAAVFRMTQDRFVLYL